MRDRRRRCPQVESLETKCLLSAAAAHAHLAAERHPGSPAAEPARGAHAAESFLTGALNGTYFAHGDATTQTVDTYSLFASGRLPEVGRTLLVGGFQTAGSRTPGADRGNLILIVASDRADINVRLTTTAAPSVARASEQTLAYEVTGGTGPFANARGSGTVDVTLRPETTNIHGQPASNPGFFGNATLTFRPNPRAGS